jgi:putative DNA methylase
MTQPYKKKLIEVAIPLEAINAASAREKSIRHGHPSTLHLWWARRPLAACRAVLFAQLVDDPSSLPDEFPTTELQDAERKRLFAIIEDLVKWENSTNEEVLERARAEIRRSCGGVLPPIYDPFSGGGSIPLEAQRLGLPAYGSDLNPVAVMIGKAMIEIPPKFKDQKPIHPGIRDRNHYRNAEGLAEDVKYYGEWMREKAWERIGHLYPQVDLPKEMGGGKATVIAWIWARTVPSPDPAFADTQVPIASSFLLSSKKNKETWIEPLVDKVAKTIEYRIRKGGTKSEIEAAKKGVKSGRANFICLMSGSPMDATYIRRQSMDGKLGVQLIAIVAESQRGRVFIAPQIEHQAVAFEANPKWRPSEKVPSPSHDVDRLPMYGMPTWGDAYTERQLSALTTFSDLVHEARDKISEDAIASGMAVGQRLEVGGTDAKAYAEAVSVYLAFAVDRTANTLTTLARWTPDREQTVTAFARQALPMTWDFPEVNPFGGGAGDYAISVRGVIKGTESLGFGVSGSLVQMDAQSVKYPAGAVISTDPPYYDNISYSDVADYFYAWMRPSLKSVFPNMFSLLATPKSEELIAAPHRHSNKDSAEAFFLDGMSKAISRMAEGTGSAFPATIYYAFKQSEIAQEGISSTGWATFLQAVVEAGYAVVGTWPMRTEMANRMIASGTNALANSVVLVCRKKEVSAETITRAEFIRALKRELPSAIKELQAANIAPADMPQSAIGPGMGVFSRYRAVLESDDSPMSVKAALQLINRELDEYLGGIQGEFDNETRFSITWFEQHGLNKGDFGAADSLARARGLSVDDVKHAGIVESQAGKVRILRRDELDVEWEPETDTHLTVWECCQHLVRLHEKHGIGYETAVMLKKFGSDKAEAVKDLAYILYDLCANKRQDAKEATAYNALIADWSDLTREAAVAPLSNRSGQSRFDL